MTRTTGDFGESGGHGAAEPAAALGVLISQKEIADRVGSLAERIDRDYAGAGTVVLVGVLKGSFIFLADLARRLTIPHRIEFIAVSSYGARSEVNPESARLLMDVHHAIEGDHVSLVEDIVDTGRTLAYLRRLLEARRPASLKTCSLLRKSDRTEEFAELEYLGFTIPDVWAVGYGLDYAERYRTLPFIAELPEELR
jgi:hypoxanthine phosphoribosyltransferase